jgi:predicted HTH domain antitoxin
MGRGLLAAEFMSLEEFRSLGKAVELSGLRRPDFESLLGEYRIEHPGSLEHLQNDLGWASSEGEHGRA